MVHRGHSAILSVWFSALAFLLILDFSATPQAPLAPFSRARTRLTRAGTDGVLADGVLFHLISISTDPLPAIAMAAVDSVWQHTPDARVKLHITVEAQIPEEALNSRKAALDAQLRFFQRKGMQITARLYTAPEELTEHTPLVGLPLRREHLGGTYGQPAHKHLRSHASDIVRYCILFREGGIYMDFNSIALRDVTPILRRFGTAILAAEKQDEFTECYVHHVMSAWIALPPGHPLLQRVVARIAVVLANDGVDCWLPANASLKTNVVVCPWAGIGPAVIAWSHQQLCLNGPFPLLVSDLATGKAFDARTNKTLTLSQDQLQVGLLSPRQTAPFFRRRGASSSSSYVLLSRKYFVPAYWDGWEADLLYTLPNASLETLAWARRHIDIAYFFHVFNEPKERWLEMLERPDLYPFVSLVMSKACKELCTAVDLRKLTFSPHEVE